MNRLNVIMALSIYASLCITGLGIFIGLNYDDNNVNKDVVEELENISATLKEFEELIYF